MVTQTIDFTNKADKLTSSNVMASRRILSLGGSLWFLHGCFCEPIHDMLHPIRNTTMVMGKNKSMNALLRLCFLTTCNITPGNIHCRTRRKTF